MVFVEVTDDLTVRSRSEVVSLCFELATQLGIVVDLAVVEQRYASIGIEEGLVTAFDVVDGESPHATPERPVAEVALIVGAPMMQSLDHALQRAVRDATIRSEASNAAH